MNDPRLLKLKNEKQDFILKNFPGVVGVGISEKVSNGQPTGKKAITVYVQKKVAVKSLSADKVINKNAFVMSGLNSDEIDIKEIGVIRALNKLTKSSVEDAPWQHQQKMRPVPVGSSEGHFKITAGTSGPLVRSKVNGVLGRISNNHVYADENRALIGDSVFQPGPYDGGKSSDTVGTLLNYVPIVISDEVGNKVDCAVRSANLEFDVPAVLNVPGVPIGIREAEADQDVIKSGRTTGVTRGKITDIAASILVAYDQGDVLFENQVIIESDTAFSQGGDSGSGIWIEENGKLHWVALLFAGNEDGSFTVANHATDVAEGLEVELYVPAPIEPPAQPPAEPPADSPDKSDLIIGGIVTAVLIVVGWIVKIVFNL